MRNRSVFIVFLVGILSFSHAHAEQLAQQPRPALRFLSTAEARTTLTEGAGKQYFENLQLAEMRAKTRLRLEGMSLLSARESARKHYAEEVTNFTKQEKSSIEYTLKQLTAGLAEKAPAFLQTPWCFIKVSDRIEGGLPHTRGECIVLPSGVLQSFTENSNQENAEKFNPELAYLLVHEQTHVLQRRNPAIFMALYTDIFHFQHLNPAPTTPWLKESGVVNPDGPDTGWALQISNGSSTRWIMPYLVLGKLTNPKMPDDFLPLGIEVIKSETGWSVANRSAVAVDQALQQFFAYAQEFPNPDQAYHPNEISADLIAAWVTGRESTRIRHPLFAATVEWAQRNLK
jgi:hypothetical protein